MNYEDLTDYDLAIEILKRTYGNIGNEDQKAINEMAWAMGESPKIRKCLEHMLTIVFKIQIGDADFQTAMCNAVELNTIITEYQGLVTEKRLERIEKHLGIELNFEKRS